MNTNPKEMTGLPAEQPFDVTLVEEKLKNVETLADITGPNGLMQEIFKKTIERILLAEQEKLLGYHPHKKHSTRRLNARNGFSKKTLNTALGTIELDIPRDRRGEFEPRVIKKHQRTDPQLENQILGLYSRGMSTRDIADQLHEIYGVEVSADFISGVTDAVMPLIQEWQGRPLKNVYPVVFLDAIHYKIRQDGKIVSKAFYTVMGIDLEGKVDVLGMWVGEKEGAHFWSSVLCELKQRGVTDILLACVDGLNGFPDAIAAHFPQTEVQLCVVHQIRSSLRYIASKHQKAFLSELKEVYKAPTQELAELNLQKLDENWGSRYPSALDGWKRNWNRLNPYFAYPESVRSMIYTTNAVEALHRCFRKVTRAKTVFPTDDSLRKILYLAIQNLKGAFRTKRDWTMILGHLKTHFGDRIPDRIL